ncbi:MAG: translation initiation factor IF-2, partial [Spirochaetales bacterium]|nr:translation initiation factor IF-2 [Spirochaetales bacterium]
MAEDDKKPKTTLIKNRPLAVETPKVEEETQKPSEKKRVVVVKKRVVKVRPQPKVVEKPVEEAPKAAKAPVEKPVEVAKPEAPPKKKKAEPKVEPTIPSVVVRAPKNLPPVPGQGQSAEDHAIWRRNNQAQAAAREQQRRSSAPTTRGTVGGQPRRPAPQGARGPRQPFQQRPPRPGGGAPAPGMEQTPQRTSKKVYRKRKEFRRPERVVEREFQIKRKDVHKANPVPKRIDIMEVITVADLAKKMNLKASEIIGKLLKMGMMVTINQQIDSDVATLIASEYDCEVNIVSLYDETLIATEKDQAGDLVPRAPIVTIMGHVDHGKTKLLDAIRSTDVVSDEFGGITQHIGAYKVKLPGKGDVVFLDTPGHAAFTLMRARGAQVTDIVVLVVAANDGVKVQTLEAIDHARAAKVPIIVAINKIDLPEANLDRVKQQLSDHGLMPEEWGGDTLFCEISALKKIGIENLLDTILLQAEMLELEANPDVRAEGKVLESRIDQGRGIVASIIIERGTLRQGDNFVAGIYPGKVRAMNDDKGNRIEEAGPATPVEIIGMSDIPGAGDPFQVTENERQARQVGAKRQELERLGQAKNVKKVTLENIYETIEDGSIDELNVIIKGDVQGSVEAVQNALEELSTDEIHLNVIRASAGAIIEDDVNLAIASNALVLGFNVRPTPRAQLLSEQEKIEIRKYNIIYDAVDDIRSAMEGMLAPEKREQVIGEV